MKTNVETNALLSHPPMRRRKNLRKLGVSVSLHTLLTVLAILWMIPVFWLLLSSFRGEKGAFTPYLWPQILTLRNYVRLFTDTSLFNFPRWFLNTLFVACVCASLLPC